MATGILYRCPKCKQGVRSSSRCISGDIMVAHKNGKICSVTPEEFERAKREGGYFK
jgi:hypothetical protein